MADTANQYTVDRVFRIVVAALLTAGLIWVLRYLSDVLIPFAVAALLAYLLNPFVRAVQKKVKNRMLAVILTLTAVFLILAAVVLLISPLLVEEVGHMRRLLAEFIRNTDLTQQAKTRLPPDLWQTFKDYLTDERVMEIVQTGDFWQVAQKLFQRLVPGIWSVITGTAGFAMGIIGLGVILLYLVFLLRDFENLIRTWKDYIPPAHRTWIVELAGEFEKAMGSYFRAQTLIAAIIAVISAAGFWLIGLPLGILLGLFVGLLNMVPYLQILGLVPALILATVHALETGMGFVTVYALTLAVFAVGQILQEAVLNPKIIGKASGLSPVVILLSLTIWGKLMGLLGLIAAIPLTCLVLAYYRRYLAKARAAQKQA